MGKIKDLLETYEDYVDMNGASEEEVLRAEEEIGVRFNNAFREYLLECGAASANGHELKGVVKNKRLDIVKATMEARKKNPNIPNGLYVIEDLATDKIVTWQNKMGELFQTVDRSEPEMISRTFEEYIKL